VVKYEKTQSEMNRLFLYISKVQELKMNTQI